MAAVQNNFSKTSTPPVLSCGEFASDFRDWQGYTALCTVQLNGKLILDRRLNDFIDQVITRFLLTDEIHNFSLGLEESGGYTSAVSRYLEGSGHGHYPGKRDSGPLSGSPIES